MQHGKVGSITELVSFCFLGAMFEGILNPWWNMEINRKIRETGSVDEARVTSLRFFLNNLVWTPLCCEFYLVYMNVLSHPIGPLIAELGGFPSLVDALLSVSEADAAAITEELVEFSDVLMDEIEIQSVYLMGASVLTTWVPPPLRPLFMKLVEAGSWTVLD